MAPKHKETKKRKASTLEASTESQGGMPVAKSAAAMKRPAGSRFPDSATARAAVAKQSPRQLGTGTGTADAVELGVPSEKVSLKRPAGTLGLDASASARSSSSRQAASQPQGSQPDLQGLFQAALSEAGPQNQALLREVHALGHRPRRATQSKDIPEARRAENALARRMNRAEMDAASKAYVNALPSAPVA